MASPRQKEFDREFRRHIDRHTAALVPALREIVGTPVPPVVKLLAFEMQSDWRSFPVHVFAVDDQSPDEAYFEPPFYAQLLPDAGPLIQEGAIDQDGYEEAGVATFESGAAVMAEWLGECWQAAGGASFPIPAYIHHHDRSRYFDLRARRWASDSDIWPSTARAGFQQSTVDIKKPRRGLAAGRTGQEIRVVGSGGAAPLPTGILASAPVRSTLKGEMYGWGVKS